MPMPVDHVLPEIILALGAAMILVAVLFLPRQRQAMAAPAALVVLAMTALATATLQIRLPAQITFSGTWALDGATAWASYIVLGATAVAVVLSPEWMRTDPRHGEYYALLLLSALGAILIAGAADTMELLVGVLLSSVTGYTLAAYHRRSAASVEAGMKYFLLGALANALLLLGIILLFGLAGSTRYGETSGALQGSGFDAVAAVAAVGLVAVGLALKLGAVPVHAWVPDVAQGAPAPAAAFLTVVPKVAGLVALARFAGLLPEALLGWRPLVALLAAATMTVGNLAALWQDDVRRLLGWSAVSQSGYGIMAVVALERSDLALPALLYFAAAYGIANLAAFAVVTELRGLTELERYTGLARQHPWLVLALAIGFLSLVGIPPLAGFTAKVALFAVAIEAGYGWLALLAVANTVVSLFYYLRVLAPMTQGQPRAEPAPLLARAAGAAAMVCMAGTVALGIGAEPLIRAFSGALILP